MVDPNSYNSNNESANPDDEPFGKAYLESIPDFTGMASRSGESGNDSGDEPVGDERHGDSEPYSEESADEYGENQEKQESGEKLEYSEVLERSKELKRASYAIFRSTEISYYGFDTLSRKYGTKKVVSAILEHHAEHKHSLDYDIDEVFSSIAPGKDKGELVEEIYKEGLYSTDGSDFRERLYGASPNTPEATIYQQNGKVRVYGEGSTRRQGRLNAMMNMYERFGGLVVLVEDIRNSEIFDAERKAAEEAGMDVVEYMSQSETGSSFSTFLQRAEDIVGQQASKNVGQINELIYRIGEQIKSTGDSIRTGHKEALDTYEKLISEIAAKIENIDDEELRVSIGRHLEGLKNDLDGKIAEIEKEIEDATNEDSAKIAQLQYAKNDLRYVAYS